MDLRRFLIVACSACALLIGGVPDARALPSAFRADVVARLPVPTGLAFTPDGELLFVTERTGDIRVIRDGELQDEPFAHVDTTTSGEGGLLGIAVHPRYAEGEPFVYVFATTPDGSRDRVIRFRSDGERGSDREEIFRMPAGSPYHHGGVLAFGPDGKLYVTNGEAHEQRRAQDPRVLGGKIYRLNDDGSIPDDNPFEGEPTWSYGHRNPFGLAFDPETGNLWSSENGPERDDEVNRIVRGGNYGWPVVTGPGGGDRFRDPVITYNRIVVPTMMAFAGDAFPERYRGDLFMGTFADGALRRLVLDEDRTDVREQRIFERFDEGVVGVAWGPDGLYVTTAGYEGTGHVHRIRARAAPSPSETTEGPSPTASETEGSPTPAPREDDGDGSALPWVVGAVLGLGLVAGVGWMLARRGR